MINHPFPPLYNEHSKILILGSFPSVASREQMFFYGHKQNRFWNVLAAIFECEPLQTVKQKRQFLLSHNIALWDVIGSCEITGSSDSSIRNVIANDMSVILNNSKVQKIFVNGKTAEKYYNMYTRAKTGITAICLPSTSPANARYSLPKLIEQWQIIRQI